MPQRAPSALILATAETLERLTAESRHRDRGMLPSLQQLARDLRISVPTLLKAVRLLEGRGIVRSVHGKGVLIVGASPSSTGPDIHADRHDKWESVKAEILRDLASGALPSDRPLPSIKELQHRYGACFVTVRKALDALVGELDLRPHKKSYAVRASRRGGMHRIAVIVPGLPTELVPGLFEGLIHDLLQGLERRAAQANLRVEVLSDVSLDSKDLSRDDSLIGCCLLGAAVSGRTDVIRQLVASGKPLAVVDETEDHTAPPGNAPPANVKIFLLGASVHGPRKIAQHLAALGHRRIAVISPWNTVPTPDGSTQLWPHARQLFAGLSAAMTALDRESEVLPFSFDELGEQPRAGATAASIESHRQSTLARVIPVILNQVGSLTDEISPALRAMARRFSQRLGAHVPETDLASPLFEPYRLPAQRTEITAWVTAYDIYGFAALRFLRQSGIKVPHDHSLVSFGDSAPAMLGKFSSYNVNPDAAVTGVLDHLLHPSSRRSLHKAAVVHIEGHIVDRGTTGRARELSR